MQLPEIEEFDDSASESNFAPSRDLINEALGLLNSQEGSAVLRQSHSANAAVDELLRQSVPRELHLCISGMPEESPSPEMNLCVSPLQNRQSPTELNLCASRLNERRAPIELNFCVAPSPESKSPTRDLSLCVSLLHERLAPTEFNFCVSSWQERQSSPTELTLCASQWKEQSASAEFYRCAAILPDYEPYTPSFDSLRCVRGEAKLDRRIEQLYPRQLPEFRAPIDINACVATQASAHSAFPFHESRSHSDVRRHYYPRQYDVHQK